VAQRTFAVVRRSSSPKDDSPANAEHIDKVYEIIREQDGRFWLGGPDHQLSVAPDQLLNVGALPFGRGDHVRLTDGRVATIVDCVWHYKQQQPMYFLAFDGKKSSRRYFPEELTAAK
jgi:hypothetical protein